MPRNTWIWIGFAGLAVAALILFLANQYPGALDAEESRMRLVYLVVLLTAVGGSLMAGWRGAGTQALKQLLVWAAIGFALVVAYSFRDDFGMLASRVGGELVPSQPIETEPGRITLRTGQDGHFHVDALVNGSHVRFLVDTGASDVALTEDDARRLGVDLSKLNFTRIYRTANGRVAGAAFTLDEIRVGPLVVHDVPASITQGGGLEQSLLGMSFLSRLEEVKFDGDRLVLRN